MFLQLFSTRLVSRSRARVGSTLEAAPFRWWSSTTVRGFHGHPETSVLIEAAPLSGDSPGHLLAKSKKGGLNQRPREKRRR